MPEQMGAEQATVRLGMESVRNVGDDLAALIAAGRPYASMEDLVRRTGAPLPAVEALATAGAFASLELERREALWGAGAVAQAHPDRLAGVVCGTDAPGLPEMSEPEVAAADLWATGVSPHHHPVQFARPHLDGRKAVPVSGLSSVAHGRRVVVGGVVTHRQRPSTAQGTVFLNLEDETGMVNVICSPPVWARHRRVALGSTAVVVTGRLERATDGPAAINLVAHRIESLSLAVAPGRSRDFR
jgi:error-prone DNA polymerase